MGTKERNTMKQKFLLTALAVMASVMPVSWSEDHVTICHFPPGNPANVQTITIGSSAVPHHFANHPGDDYIQNYGGACTNGTAGGGSLE
jgi:hypothetical protein